MYEKEEKYMKKVAFATGSRADYGIMREYLRLLNNDENIDLSILVTGALLDDKYGNQVSLIEDDGFYIESKVKVDLNSTSNKNILLSIGEIIKSFAEVFDKNKLLNGIIKACYKRPVSSEQMNRMVENISQCVSNSLRHEIPSSELGGMVMDELRDIDEVSYVRFASVYREFKDAETFMEELYKLGGGCRVSEGGQKINGFDDGREK